MKCPYCNDQCQLVAGSKLYPKTKAVSNRDFYVCWGCDAVIICKPGTTEPNGLPAKKSLRMRRKQCLGIVKSFCQQYGLNSKEELAKLLKAFGKEGLGFCDETDCSNITRSVNELRKSRSLKEIVLEEPKHPCKCAHCGELCKMTRGHYFHPGVFHEKNKIYYYCEPCQALARSKNGVPLETAANEQLRNLRSECSTKLSSMAKKYRVSEGEIARDFFSLPLESPVGSYTLPMCKAVLS